MKVTPVGMEIKRAHVRYFMGTDSKRLGRKRAMKNEGGRVEMKAYFLSRLNKIRQCTEIKKPGMEVCLKDKKMN